MTNRLGLSAADIRTLMSRAGEPLARAERRSVADLNGVEREFLALLVAREDIIGVWPHGIRLVLGDNDRYEPDFMVQFSDGRLEIFEVKAQWTNGQRGMADSREKVKCAASLFPFPVTIASKQPKKQGGGWHYERFEPKRRNIEPTPPPPAAAAES